MDIETPYLFLGLLALAWLWIHVKEKIGGGEDMESINKLLASIRDAPWK